MRKGGTNRALETCIFALDVRFGPKVERQTGNGRQKFLARIFHYVFLDAAIAHDCTRGGRNGLFIP
ncbi:MAG: hypothetical protein WA430_03755, partial [Acidobacteriaceae bacterium]